MGSWDDLPDRAKVIGVGAGAIVAVIGVLIQGPAAWRSWGFPAIAWESYVDARVKYVEEKIKPISDGIADLKSTVVESRMATYRLQRSGLDNEIFRLRQILESVSDLAQRALIQQRVNDAEEEVAAVRRRIAEIDRDRYGNR